MTRSTAFLTTAMTILLCPGAQATVWRVNYSTVFATNCLECQSGPNGVQNAINLAEADDTIHVEPSPFQYTAIILDKPLTIIGAGFLHGVDDATLNENMQANPNFSKILEITFTPQSAGSKMTGIVFGGTGNITQGIAINANDITLDRNMRLANANNSTIYIIGTNLSNITISRNFLYQIRQPATDQTINNLLITNNYFEGSIGLEDAGDALPNLSIQHNTFNGNVSNTFYMGTFAYNILAQGSVVLNNNDIHHNLAVSTTGLPNTGAGTFNQNGGVTPLFVGSGTLDAKWKLAAGSPALTWGDDEVQLGMYGGAAPYILSGIPNIPAIYKLQSTLNTTPGGTVEITLSTRSNN